MVGCVEAVCIEVERYLSLGFTYLEDLQVLRTKLNVLGFHFNMNFVHFFKISSFKINNRVNGIENVKDNSIKGLS